MKIPTASLSIVLTRARSFARASTQAIRRHPRIAATGTLVIIIGGYAAFQAFSHAPEAPAVQTPFVELINVSAYASRDTLTSASAAVHETVLHAEAGGMVTRVTAPGTRVAAGTIIAQLDNDTQRAALVQTEGALDSAKASQQKVLEGTRSEQRDILAASYRSAKDGAVAALLSTYGSMDSAVRDTADQMFTEPEGNTPKLAFFTPDSGRDTSLGNMRPQLTPILTRERAASANVSPEGDLTSEIARTQDEVRTVRSFLDTLIATLNTAIPSPEHPASQIASYKAAATAARTSLTGALSSLTTAQNTLVSAQKSLEQANNGAQDTDIASAAAGVKQSQGAYASAIAAYDKTLVRARTAGTVVACSAKAGDVVTIGADICRIASSDADLGGSFALPLSAVKYAPAGAYVYTLNDGNTIRTIPVETGLVTADVVTVYGLSGDESIVKDVRGLREGDVVATH